MPPSDPTTEESAVMEYDVWRWHTEGSFPRGRPLEQGYVHIGMFLVWLMDLDMLDPEWVAQPDVALALPGMRSRETSACSLRDITDGRLSSDMLTPEGRGFTSAYYAPQYGYTRDWNRVFGRLANTYGVPDDWSTYERIGPVIERRYEEWVAAGRPELMPMPRLLNALLRFAQSKSHKPE